ncbi:hypothetical protein [Gilliamella sp. wkB108]|uniref:hypothetical protein n=1 Tax=Gilliamella sp. wkB108 TaxID=3120256 RepID=UPI001146F61D|nr:hypothetical protein [Gilliamella apicola]
MMINKIGKKIIIVLAFFSIKVLANAQAEVAPTNNSDKTINKISRLLEQEQYQPPDSKKFKQKIDDYFGLNTGVIMDDFCQTHTSEDNYYGITNNGKFIYSCSLMNLFSNGTSDDEKDKYVQQLIAYNKLLFNDDDSAKNYLLKHKYFLAEPVVNFNYEKDIRLYEIVVSNSIVSDEDEWHFLFYNNESKGYRKRFLNDMLLDKAYFRGLLMTLYINWNKKQKNTRVQGKEVIISQATKDKALIHLIKYRSYLQNNGETLERSQHLAYQYLTDFSDKDNQLKERLKKNNYYGMGIIVSEEKQKVISNSHNEILENHYHTKSGKKDINLHQKANIKSPIIMKLANHTDVIKLYINYIDFDKNNEWLHVKLANNPSISGYIPIKYLEYSD